MRYDLPDTIEGIREQGRVTANLIPILDDLAEIESDLNRIQAPVREYTAQLEAEASQYQITI